MTDMPVREIRALGFVGLGVMGEAMCRNLARKSGLPVTAFDLRPDTLTRLAADGVTAADSVAAAAKTADILFLSLPDGPALEAVALGDNGHLGHLLRPGSIVIDHTTAPVDLTRRLAQELSDHGVHFLDAPVARTWAAAVDGTLAIMVGGEADIVAAARPVLGHMGTAIQHCGGVGCGQIAKLMNNKVLAETVLALADALAIARRQGMDGQALFETLMEGSADSFALRNHGMNALLPGEFPAEAFSARYMLKDLTYALDLADAAGIAAPSARLVAERLQQAIDAGDGERYFPVMLNVIESAADEGMKDG